MRSKWNPCPDPSFYVGAKEFAMTRHPRRAQLLRSFAGAASAMIVCAAAIFTAAHHLAG
jgi:hypothetical protein